MAQLMVQPLHGPRVSLLLGRLLPPGVVTALGDGPPEAAAAALVQHRETPEMLWTADMALSTAEELRGLAAAARAQQVRLPGKGGGAHMCLCVCSQIREHGWGVKVHLRKW